MTSRSPLDYDVSVTAAKARQRRRRGMSGAVESSTRVCDWPGCEARGLYRAPRAPDRLTEYRWFCLDHVRDYNRRWNFFADCDEGDLAEALSRATVWERPTWRLGGGPSGPQGLHAHAEGNAWARWGFADPLDVLGDNATIAPGPAEGRPRRRLPRREQQALDTLGVAHQVEARAEVRAAYRALVKELHPDMNGGENPDPERLALVLKAWELLRRSPSFTD